MMTLSSIPSLRPEYAITPGNNTDHLSLILGKTGVHDSIIRDASAEQMIQQVIAAGDRIEHPGNPLGRFRDVGHTTIPA